MSTDSEKLDEQQTVEAAPETPGAEATPQLDLAAELEKYKDLALRTRADLENYRKRAIREKEEAIRYANASLVESLVPIFDNFELGLSAARTATDPSGIVMGLDMVRKQLEDFLRDYGIEAVDAVGQTFDPNLHEAMAQEESDTVPEGTVLRQIRKGFKLKDRLIRPASVVVSKGPAQG
ncbi:molecular chaperone GrpE [Terrimicrobium sacchariphilum]|jgi:molecular chaperone GrpE|uniref:Protein GrpE n=1 Tax=Terrimicrobium sacchariphilum TaxID=690879 RepID=A0A146GCE7_TERSA|nr:nucleotide exchange factor GrpE [Terrimicrobium sacchariphilum]GAT35269.1 molecular chaperone GrpE [Terrimicrobium sacchariphilum]